MIFVVGACGPQTRSPGGTPGEVVFWRITSSEVSFTDCTDEADFRDSISPVAYDQSSYLIYRIEPDGKRATSLTCRSLNPSSCTENPTGTVYEIAGNELISTRETKDPIGTGGCQLQLVQQVRLTDYGETLDVDIANIVSLVDHEQDCARVEAQLKAQAPNQTGLQGCVVRFTLRGAHAD